MLNWVRSKFVVVKTSFVTELDQHLVIICSIQLATFLVLVVSVLMVTLPGHTLDLLLYIISRPSLDLPQLTQQSLAENLSPGLVSGLGWLVLLSSLAFTIPALTGYVGAVRESRFCLILVRIYKF